MIGIVAFAFGVPSTISSNQCIAEIAMKKALELDASIFTQPDINVGIGARVEYAKEIPGQPPPTLRIARQSVQWAKQNGFTGLYIVAAKPHLRRVLRDMRVAIDEAREKIDLHVCEEIYREGSWFCPDSTQPWTQSSGNWKKREMILNVMPLFLYKIVAK